MVDVSKITGPTGPREPNKDKQAADAAKFKELMRVQKVGEVDEEQKKKRKRQDESETESKADTEEAVAAQAGQKAPLENTPQKSLKIEGPSAPGAATPAAPPAATPPPQEPEPHYMEEESFMGTLPSADIRTNQDRDDQEQTARADRTPRPQEKKVEGAKTKAISEYKEAELRDAEKAAMKKKKKAEELSTEQVSAQAPAPLTQESKKSDKEKKVDEIQAGSGMQASTQAAPLTGTPSTPTAPAPYAQLHPMVLDLFERMVGVMTVMSTAGITETTVTLSSPQYANSVFFGAQIIVKEYSTAPKAFNIQIITNSQGASLVQANADDLMAAFRTGNYNFKINRLEAGISAEKPLFRRKEGIGRDKEEDKK